MLDNPQEFEIIRRIDPDIIVVILRGNSICENNTNLEINDLALEFYTRLGKVVRPDCLKMAVQIEPRIVEAGNRFQMPEPEEFNRRRAVINNFMNKKLKKCNLINNVILLGSVNILRDPKYFTDGVHLKKEGLMKYRDAVIGGLVYALENK